MERFLGGSNGGARHQQWKPGADALVAVVIRPKVVGATGRLAEFLQKSCRGNFDLGAGGGSESFPTMKLSCFKYKNFLIN